MLVSPLSIQPLSPLDGRYQGAVSALGEFLSEAGLNRARVAVEIEWLIFQTEHGFFDAAPLSSAERSVLRNIAESFSDADVAELARLEATTKHDVKAVEYFIRARLSQLGLERLAELTHFACTSEDINNLDHTSSC